MGSDSARTHDERILVHVERHVAATFVPVLRRDQAYVVAETAQVPLPLPPGRHDGVVRDTQNPHP
ncbi:hypothetical protein GCM10025774_36060 [Microbacterium kyungheense]